MSAEALLTRPASGGEVPAAPHTARVLVVDGEGIVRFGLRQLFAAEPDLAVVGEAGTARDAVLIADRCRPDLVIIDIDLGAGTAGGNGVGVDVARTLLQRRRGARVLVLTNCRDREVMLRAVRCGVHGYLRKGVDTTEIVRAARAVLRGESVFDSRTPAMVVDVLRDEEGGTRRPRGQMLTERENQVLKLLAVGMSNREIAVRLLISEATVKFHVRNLREKLDVRRRTEIVYTATRQGMV